MTNKSNTNCLQVLIIMRIKSFTIIAIICLLAVFIACRSGMPLAKQLKKMPSKAMLVSEAEACGFTLDTMTTIYPNGLSFFGDTVPKKYLQSWTDFCVGLGSELSDAGLKSVQPYRLWGRVYFAPDGTVEHYFYKWLGNRQPDAEWQKQFKKVLEAYLNKFQFTYPMNRRFAQCGVVQLEPKD